ncbi:hypothetical protein [Singulisphaera sp. GP187]|uniref:hypothetical protein n=1 Tax=Singulisphaera sp. GP187 TaxID=1882752 RepID=UPI0009416C7B|nr:hypothetical protein [Singulisphaera sp. GP187]
MMRISSSGFVGGRRPWLAKVDALPDVSRANGSARRSGRRANDGGPPEPDPGGLGPGGPGGRPVRGGNGCASLLIREVSAQIARKVKGTTN